MNNKQSKGIVEREINILQALKNKEYVAYFVK